MGFWSSIGSAFGSSTSSISSSFSSDNKVEAKPEKFEKYDEMLKDIQNFDLEPTKTNDSHEVIDIQPIKNATRKKQP
jgi:hypothetical protein